MINKKEKGQRVKLLDDMPILSVYENLVLSAVNKSQSISDIVHYMDVMGIRDREAFLQIVLSLK